MYKISLLLYTAAPLSQRTHQLRGARLLAAEESVMVE